MYALTKIEILECLKDYSQVLENFYHNPQVNIKDIFLTLTQNHPEKQNEKYFYRMINVYCLVSYMIFFSYLVDSDLDFLDNHNLDFDDIKTEIFVNSEDAKFFSNKQIIKYLRNAFNHNEKDQELFKISINAKYIEIDLKNVKPKAFHVKLSFKHLSKIINAILTNRQNYYIALFDTQDFNYQRANNYDVISNLKLLRIFFPKKVSKEIIEVITLLLNFNDTKNSAILENVEKLLKEHNILYKLEKYDLNEEQKQTLYQKFKGVKNETVKDILSKNLHFNQLIFSYFFYNIIPQGLAKEERINYEIMLASEFIADKNMSYQKLKNKINDLFSEDEFNQKLLIYASDSYASVSQSVITYLSYLVTTVINSEYIIIDNEKYEREHIRCALVHGRYFLGANNNLELYDCSNRYNNDYKFD